jgi:hypothetical protein
MLGRGIQLSASTPPKMSAPTRLMDGQMIFARVNKLLPEGMAEVNYNDRKIIAKLEAPLAAGKNYLFHAEAGKEGQLKLRVVPGLASEAEFPLTDRVLSELQLTKAGNIKEVLSLLMKNSLPFNRAELGVISELLAATKDKQAALEIFMTIKESGFQVSKPLFLSYLHGKNMDSLSTMFTDLETKMKTSGHKSMAYEKVLGIIRGIQESENSNLFQKAAIRSADMMMDPETENIQRSTALKLLQSMALIPEDSKVAGLNSLSAKELMNNGPAARFLNSSPSLFQIKDKLITLLELVEGSQSQDETARTIIKDVQSVLKGVETGKIISQEELLKTAMTILAEGDGLFAQKGLMQPLSGRERFNLLFGVHTSREKELISGFSLKLQQLQQTAEPKQPSMKLLQQLAVSDEGNVPRLHKEALPDIIKDLISRLGLNQEAKIAASHPQDRTLYDSLKPSLIALLKEGLEGGAKESVENLLYKLNGPSILSGENGPLQQVIYQFPLTWLNQNTEVMMQWSGRKTENGQVDPEFCRVLFYLELENIKDVIVDMSVQHRIITLTIYNDTQKLKELAAPFSAVMKEGLERLDYKVSSINFKSPGKTVSSKEVYRELAGEVSYSGVDLQI